MFTPVFAAAAVWCLGAHRSRRGAGCRLDSNRPLRGPLSKSDLSYTHSVELYSCLGSFSKMISKSFHANSGAGYREGDLGGTAFPRTRAHHRQLAVTSPPRITPLVSPSAVLLARIRYAVRQIPFLSERSGEHVLMTIVSERFQPRFCDKP